MKRLHTSRRWRCLAALLLLGTAAARAHDPYLSYTDVTVRPAEIEVDCSMGRFTATRLFLDNPASAQAAPASITPDNFSNYVPPLKKEAVKLFEISIGGTLVTAREVDVQLNEEGDAVDFTIIYPRPASGAVRIAPVYIKLLPDDGYATALTVYDDARNILNAGETLNTESPTYDLASPPPAKPAASPAPGK